MGFFNRSGVSRPTAAPSVAGAFPGTSIHVTPAQGQAGDYVATVFRHLAEIQAFPVGRDFLATISDTGKRINISFGGPNSNQCKTSEGGYVKLRKHFAQSDNTAFSAELRATIGRIPQVKPRVWLAEALMKQTIPTWQGGTRPSPFGPMLSGVQGVASVARVNEKIDVWLAGNGRPSVDEMDVLVLVLMEWLTPGTGMGSRINYDPGKIVASGERRPPHVALFHELTHAYFNAIGRLYGSEDSASEFRGGRLFELQAVGLPPFDTNQFSENTFRAATGTQPRRVYP